MLVKLLSPFFERGSDTLKLTGMDKRVPLMVIKTITGRFGNQRSAWLGTEAAQRQHEPQRHRFKEGRRAMSTRADWLLGLGWMILTQLLAWQADTMSETALILLASLMGITILAGWAYPMRFEEWENEGENKEWPGESFSKTEAMPSRSAWEGSVSSPERIPWSSTDAYGVLFGNTHLYELLRQCLSEVRQCG